MKKTNYNLNAVVTFLLLNGKDTEFLIEDLEEILTDSTFSELEKEGAIKFILRKVGLVDNDRIHADLIESVLMECRNPKEEQLSFIVNSISINTLNGKIKFDIPLN